MACRVMDAANVFVAPKGKGYKEKISINKAYKQKYR